MKLKHRSLKAQTLELLKVYREQPTLELRNQLVELNLGLVRKEAMHWNTHCREEYDDLMQIGCLSLIQAIERFDISRGLAFSSFSLPYIRGGIQHYLRDKSGVIRIPRRWFSLLSRRQRVTEKLQQQLGRIPSEDEIRTEMGLELNDWQEFQIAQQNQSTLSLDAPVQIVGDPENLLVDIVPDRRYESFQIAQEDRLYLQQMMTNLEQRTRQVLEFVFFQGLTQKETAKLLDVTPVTVSRQVKKGLAKLDELLHQDFRYVSG